MGKSKELATLTDASTLDIAGDLSVGGLTVGTDQLAVDASGRVTMPYQPALLAYDVVDVSPATNATKLAFSNISAWTRGISANGTKNRFTVPTEGIYLVSVQVSGSVTTANAGDGVFLDIFRNGVTYAGQNAQNVTSTGSAVGMEYFVTNSMLIYMYPNDYIEFSFSNISSVAFSVTYGSAHMYLLG